MLSVVNENEGTTNPVEGWHSRLNTKVPTKPNVLLLMDILKKEGRHYDIHYKRKLPMNRRRRLCDFCFNEYLKRKTKFLIKRELSAMQLNSIERTKMLVRSDQTGPGRRQWKTMMTLQRLIGERRRKIIWFFIWLYKR